MTIKQKSLIGKFIKGVISGGLASVAISLESNSFNVTSIANLVTLANVLATAFISGMVLSAMKYLTWEK